jgi:hypothetical protein
MSKMLYNLPTIPTLRRTPMNRDKAVAKEVKKLSKVEALSPVATTKAGVLIPNGAAIREYGTPTSMAPSTNDPAFGYLLLRKHVVDLIMHPPTKKR